MAFPKRIVLISLLLIFAVILLGTLLNNFLGDKEEIQAEKSGLKANCKTQAVPDPLTDNITWTLPDCASPLRLSLPASPEDIFADENTGIAGYGMALGAHIEGNNHADITLRLGTPVKSWADGTVLEIRAGPDTEFSEKHIYIDYGQNLIGVHTEIKTSFVKAGDVVKRGQVVGEGADFKGTGSSAEFFLFDKGRDDGVYDHGICCTVSPFDYLEQSEKMALVQAYKKNILEPFLAGQTVAGAFHPYLPYLTNPVFLHRYNRGRISGTWWSTSTVPSGDPSEKLTFIEADNPYFTGNVVMSLDNEDVSRLNGRFEIDYAKKQIKIINGDYKEAGIHFDTEGTYYGIFEIDESGPRARLKIEYQQGTYPTTFSDRALTYIEKGNGLDK